MRLKGIKGLLLKVKVLWYSRTIKSYIAYLQEPQSCYNAQLNNCNGVCQGCSDCIIAQKWRGEVKFTPPIRIRYNILLTKEYEKIKDRIFQKMHDEQVLERIKKSVFK